MKKIGSLKFDENRVASLCNQSDIEYLALFGSMLHKDNNKDSDIDLLVRFAKPKGLFDIVRIQNLLSGELRSRVDLVTEGFLSPYFREDIKKTAKVLYVKKN